MSKWAVELGDRAKDNFTGFEGIVTARAEYLNGCRKVKIEPTKLDKDGKPFKGEWFDEQQVTVKSKAKAGGPASLPPDA